MARTPSASVASAALALLLGCGGEASGPAPSTPRVDYVDGAIEPILLRGAPIVIEGFGFGDTQSTGSISFPRAGGGTTAATIAAGDWSDRAIRTIAPDDAASGTVTVTAATGRALTATVHVQPRIAFDPATLTWQGRAAFPRAPVGVALATSTEPAGAMFNVTVYAAGGGGAARWRFGGGTLIGPAGTTWLDADGSWHGLVLGGIDLVTRLRRDGAWGF